MSYYQTALRISRPTHIDVGHISLGGKTMLELIKLVFNNNDCSSFSSNCSSDYESDNFVPILTWLRS